MQALFETSVACPYCGAQFTALIDSSGGDCDYVEDCTVCCQPIEFHLRISDDTMRVIATRGDECY